MEDILVPIFVVVVLPVAIVFIVFYSSMYSDKQRTKVLLKALDSNPNVDVDKLTDAMKKNNKTDRQILNGRLLRGCIFSLIGIVFTVLGAIAPKDEDLTGYIICGGCSLAIGISFLIVFFTTRKQVDKAEQEAATKIAE